LALVKAGGCITGSRTRHSGEKTETYRVSALIANRTRSSLARRVEIVEMDGLTVLAVEILTSRTPGSTPEGKYQRRAIGVKGKPKQLDPLKFERFSENDTRETLDRF
jgi:ATP-dependent DNA helicase RecG